MSLILEEDESQKLKIVQQSGALKKGTYRIIKTGSNKSDSLEKNDLMEGVFLEEGKEVFGIRKYLGGALCDPNSVGKLLIKQTF